MKKIGYLFIAALVALISCSKEQAAPEILPAAKKTAVIEVSLLQTKALINDEGSGEASFEWDDDDQIGVVVGGEIVPFTLTEKTEEKAKFTGEIA
jgi:hypothetical protein